MAKGRHLWATLIRLFQLAKLSQAELVEGMTDGKPYGVRGASKTRLSRKLRGEELTLQDEYFVEAFVVTCYRRGRKVPAGGPHRAWGTLDEWRTWRQRIEDGILADSPLPPPRPAARPSRLSGAAIAERERLGRVLGHRGLSATLREIYPAHPLVELWGVEMPITAFPAPRSQWRDVEAALGDLQGDRVPGEGDYDDFEFDRFGRPRFDELYASYLETKRSDPEQLRHLFPGAAFAFGRLRHEGGPKIDAFLSRYFVSLVTSEDLDAELVAALDGRPDLDAPVPLSALRRRAYLHERIRREYGPEAGPVETGRFRAAALSHATTVMLATGQGGYDILLPARSEDVNTHPGFRHVAPSGILAPFNARAVAEERTRRAEFSVWRNFCREWVEELFAADEYEGWELEDVTEPPDPALTPEIARLERAVDPRDARRAGDLYYTGVSVNLLTLRPEICLLLVIDDPGWLGREIDEARAVGRPVKLGWEYADGGIDQPWLRPGHRIRLGPDLRPAAGWTPSPTELVPNAAAAIWLALAVMRARHRS
ncbi:hypothetical protein [Actinomadura fibrosa]|uniref:Transcriptional regulator n=1 Tax=Actinomadura fibrosa TaxID=111802 RepID=A0ABW2XF57_9ACTN|nr:hypothetical protein [Actinomadura fibrosa]